MTGHRPADAGHGESVLAEAFAAADSGNERLAAELAAAVPSDILTEPGQAWVRQWQLVWSTASRDPDLTAAARAELTHALAAIDDDAQWIEAAQQTAVFLAASGLAWDARDVNAGIVARLKDAPDEQTRTVTLTSALVNLGNAHMAVGDLPAGIDTLMEAKQLLAGRIDSTAANTEYNLGVAYAEAGRVADARAAYERALAIWTEIGAGPGDRAFAVRGLAACLARTGRSDEALTQFDAAVALFEQADEPDQIDLTQVGIVQARQRRGDTFTDQELASYEEAGRRLPPSHRSAMLQNLANIHTDLRNLTEASALLDDVIGWATAMKDRPSLAKALASQAVVYRHRGRFDDALRVNREAHTILEDLGNTIAAANADFNYALILSEMATAAEDTGEHATAHALAAAAADEVLAALAVFDASKHQMPSAVDRHRYGLEIYGQSTPAAIRLCMRADRLHDVAAVVERARVQTVLSDAADGTFTTPRPIATCRGVAPVAGQGEPVVLGELAEAMMGEAAVWLGWWDDGSHLIRAWSTVDHAEAERGPLDTNALSRYNAALPTVFGADVDAANGDPRMARRVAAWRAASGPLLADHAMAARAAAVLPDDVRERVLADDGVRESFASTVDELLWPISQLLLPPPVLAMLLADHDAGRRRGCVVAPTARLGRLPWAALPLSDPRHGTPLRLIEAADITVGLPASLAVAQPSAAQPATRDDHPSGASDSSTGSGSSGGPDVVIIADPLGNLPQARNLELPDARILGATALEAATRSTVQAALRHRVRLLVLAAHVRPGRPEDPASSAVLLESETADTAIDPMTVTELADLTAPRWCVVLGCDGSGASAGSEWTGVLTGLVWAGAHEVATSTVPVIDDTVTADLETSLVELTARLGPVEGLMRWQRDANARQRRGDDPTLAVYRWATFVATRLADPALTTS